MSTDQAVLKVDVECDEIDVFDKLTVSKFFERMDVHNIHMQSMCFNQPDRVYTVEQITQISNFIAFLERMGYVVYDKYLKQQLEKD